MRNRPKTNRCVTFFLLLPRQYVFDSSLLRFERLELSDQQIDGRQRTNRRVHWWQDPRARLLRSKVEWVARRGVDVRDRLVPVEFVVVFLLLLVDLADDQLGSPVVVVDRMLH